MILRLPPAFLGIQVKLTDAYEDDELLLRETCAKLVLNLTQAGGEAVAEAEAGIIKNTGERVVACLCVPYKYNTLNSTLKLCGNDCPSELSFRFALRKVDGAPIVSFSPHDKSCGGHQASRHDALRETLCSVLDSITDKCLDSNIRVQTKHLPPPELERLCAMYHRGVLAGIYDPDNDEFDPMKFEDITLAPLTSVVTGGKQPIKANDDFVNVIGSSDDTPSRVPAGSDITKSTPWRRVWEIICGAGVVGSGNFCASTGYNHICTDSMNPYVGGHILLGTINNVGQEVTHGDNGVLILPICKCANRGYHTQLRSAADTKAAILNNYYK